MEFKFSESGWKVLGSLPKIKKDMKLASIKVVDNGNGKFVVFEQKDGSYATATYDSKASAPLQDCFLYQLPDGGYTVGPRYTTDSNVLDSL